ncbi:ATPase-like protein [Leptomonas seymouri]|uniref:ATPase-like protein n=1 Tax=Leptomonas seymouri TaxID=5684 RepID=A0A0N0P830_LEPSE|nr:ATPase-like protein [Leptomonas seymouri]|eukprot:KPI89466.1 ATPase-like protein [Leptomonas seymouri]
MTSAKFLLVVEVSTTAVRSDWAELSTLTRSYVRVQASRRLAQGHCPPFLPGAFISLTEAPSLFTDVIHALRVCDVSFPLECTWTNLEEVEFCMRLYHLLGDDTAQSNGKGAAPAIAAAAPPAWCTAVNALALAGDSDEDAPAFAVTPLPHASLEGLWESLYYGEGEAASILFKRDIVSYVETAMQFACAGVNPHLISWSRLVLFYGPPGTGKTSLCRALAQKLAVRFAASSYPRACLLDINAHSLFSRWFSESGKQVLHLFEQIHRIAEDSDCLVCCVMDEVESLAAARASAMKGNEPSDSIRVVNALLTQIDRLQRHANVLVLSTSNLTEAIDEALLDRADKRIYIGPPGLHARSVILQAAVQELLEKGLVTMPAADDGDSAATRIGFHLERGGSLREDEAMGATSGEGNANGAGDVDASDVGAHKAGRADPVDPKLQNEEAGDVFLSGDSTTPPRISLHENQSLLHPSPCANTAYSDHEAKPAAPSWERMSGHSCPAYTVTALVGHVAKVCEGLNGRTIKKLPFLAYSKCLCSGAGQVDRTGDSSAVSISAFLEALFHAARQAVAAAPSKQMMSEGAVQH